MNITRQNIEIKRFIKGQSALEISVMICFIVGALLAMQIYMKRGISGYIRRASNEISQTPFSFESGNSKTTEIVIDSYTVTVSYPAINGHEAAQETRDRADTQIKRAIYTHNSFDPNQGL